MKKKLVKAWDASEHLKGLKGLITDKKFLALFESRPKQKLN